MAPPQIGDEGQAATMLAVLPRAVQHDARARLVGIFERYLGALQQLVGAGAVGREQAHAARQAQVETHAGQMKAAAYRGDQLLRIQLRALGRAVGGQHQELGFPQTRHECR